MSRIRLEFPNAAGETLAGLLETPPPGVSVEHYALFAHCFTCGKDVAAATRISRALAARGIAVLRFDFTGLGNSDGDFANTNFSSNVRDLLAAAAKLERDYLAPTLLVGHSLGGAAVLAAASRLPAVKALATIGAPATAAHVRHLFSGAQDRLETAGEADVTIGRRRFRVRRQFLEDLDQYADDDHIRQLKRPLLIFHAPLDEIVSIDEAARIYRAAMHPKSFISLDRADHMLSDREDAEYVAETLVAWASRYLNLQRHAFEGSTGTAPPVAAGEVLVTELDTNFLRGLYARRHQWLADEPLGHGGSDRGPGPYELLLMSLGACTSMTLRMYAKRKELPLDDVEVRLRHERLPEPDAAGRRERLRVTLNIHGALTPAQLARLAEVARRCPVHRTLTGQPEILIALEEDEAPRAPDRV